MIKKTPENNILTYATIKVSRGFRYVRYVGPNDVRCNVAELKFYGIEGEGDDSQFYKPAKYLRPVVEAPFVAIKMETGIMVSMGAMKIDDHMRCLGPDGKPVVGLFSVGCDAGGLFGESYSLPIPGSANGFALTSGWLAADAIAEEIKAGAL